MFRVWQQVEGLTCGCHAKDASFGRLRVKQCSSGGNARVGFPRDYDFEGDLVTSRAERLSMCSEFGSRLED